MKAARMKNRAQATPFEKKVYSALSQIPPGKITTYAGLAKAIGNPHSARAVGNALHKNPTPDSVPCFKVVKSNGGIGGFALGIPEKIRRLKNEGAHISNNRIINFPEMEWDG